MLQILFSNILKDTLMGKTPLQFAHTFLKKKNRINIVKVTLNF